MEDQVNRIPRTLAVMKQNNMATFPYLLTPLVVADETTKKVVDYALSNDKTLAIFLENIDSTDGIPVLEEIGTSATILRMLRNQDGSISLLLQGTSRLRRERTVQEEPFTMVEVELIPESLEESSEINALRKIAIELLEQIVPENNSLSHELIDGLQNIKQSGRIADIITGNTDLKLSEKQSILATIDIKTRFEKLNRYLADQVKQVKLENTIRNNIQLEMTEDQRKYYLREQLEAIRRELGEKDEVGREIDNWRKKIEEKKLPDYVLQVAEEELSRLAAMQPASSEYGVIRNYLEWIVELPWVTYSKDRLDMKRIENILSHDHYGLEKPKERFLEYIAVKKLKGQLKGPILCFVGPPGVGKTSIGRSIARALNRQFVRLSLGGIHDEAEIRGHRRTYIGALPGKIINEIKRCGTANPVFMLDEIDKLGHDFRGDPASALLEVLDPEQNNSFVDHYINLPFNLSEVMFITTANSLDTIPPALRDRMEVIEFSSYIEEEKIEIARHYLIPKELDNNGLAKLKIKMNKSALQEIIRFYVREAGVRNLQREIGTVFRKIAKDIAMGKNTIETVGAKDIKSYLGTKRYSQEIASHKPEVGVTTGLAWTAFGGEILFCEAIWMPGNGMITMTGLLGEVMQESAKIALSYLKSNYKKYKIKPESFNEHNIHIHLPAGAVPKDGPSAGVTLTTSLASLFMQRKVKPDIAMTGEITLLGKVLPIGGLREKILAAKRAGIDTVIVPDGNRNSLEDIPKSVLKGMKLIYVKDISGILEKVLL
ncbi:MAG TPA: endopeptidase La [Candidatus Cloacimonadota bacterium]|nr:endopeptidase La [Candidatus Cloacimonadota bacterium]